MSRMPASPSPEGIRSERRRAALAVAGVAALAAIVYANTLWNGFVYDDRWQVVGNRWLGDLANIPSAFVTNVWGFQGAVSNYYRPLMHVAYILTHAAAGLAPWAFHLVNVLLHAAATALVVLAARRALLAAGADERGALGGAVIAGVLFATQPIHTEVVAWVACVPDLLLAVLALAAVLLHARGTTSSRLGAVVCVFAGLFAKETMAAVPLLLGAWDLAFERPRPRLSTWARRYLPHAAALGLYAVIRSAAGTAVTLQRHGELGALGYVVNVFPLFGEHLRALVLPVKLSAFHVFHPVESLLEPRAIVGIAATAGFVAAVAVAVRHSPAAFFALAAIALPLLPVLYIPALGENTFAERYLYLPSFGFALLVGLAFVRLRQRWPAATPWAAALAGALALAYGGATLARNRAWRDDFTLWSDTVAKSPDSAYAHNELGLLFDERGDFTKASAEYEAAIRLAPGKPGAWNNYGVLLHRAGRLDAAEEKLLRAIEVDKAYAKAFVNLGNLYTATGRRAEALAAYREAVHLSPRSIQHRISFGNGLDAVGDRAGALHEYLSALEIDPASADAHLHVGIALAEMGRLAEAIPHLQTAARLAPGDEIMRHNLARAYRLAGRREQVDAIVRPAER